MLKTIFTLILFLFLSSCGYKAIHSKKNNNSYDFSISKLSFIGDRNINLRIKEKLNNYTLNKKDKNFILNIESDVGKEILSKDASGEVTNFKISIKIKVEVLAKSNLEITENFSYNNIENKFNLKTYENQVIKDLTNTAIDKLIFKLSNIQ
jgi:outer membrane lipopolysaccharide assembly protein LptE/RlpB|tara:strand:+ start:60 stop:512 length:453 start_codon:yes stop_codon:yes gene_type:complete